MKKVISLSMVCLMALSICAVFSCTEKDNEATGSYVDLGLPSGTKWKTSNEVNAADAEYDFFTYDEAVAQFGDKLPSREQCEELINECDWTWTGEGYNVVGPNGKSISLPAAGCRDCGGSVSTVGSDGNYWSSTPHGAGTAWGLIFYSGSVYMSNYGRCSGQSVRLVQD